MYLFVEIAFIFNLILIFILIHRNINICCDLEKKWLTVLLYNMDSNLYTDRVRVYILRWQLEVIVVSLKAQIIEMSKHTVKLKPAKV